MFNFGKNKRKSTSGDDGPARSLTEGGVELVEGLKDLAGHLIGHLAELRTALLPRQEAAVSSLNQLRTAVATQVEPAEIRTLVDRTARQLREMLWAARQEHEAERQELRQIAGLVAETLSELRGSDESLETKAQEQLVRLEKAMNGGSPDAMRAVLAESILEIRRAFKDHAEYRVNQARRMNALISTLRDELHQAKEEGGRDPLTGLFNRRTFDKEISRRLDRVAAEFDTLGLLMVDIDHFKLVNDRFGHLSGDSVLREVSDMLVRTCFRKDDLVARFGGEEFAILLNGVARDDLRSIGERLRGRVESTPVQVDQGEVRVTVSVGAAVARGLDTPESLIERADAALYQAKEEGRNRVELS